VSPITIDHHRSAHACCRDCRAVWVTDDVTTVMAVLAGAAEHALETGHTVAEHVADDAVVHPLEPTMNT